MKIDENITYRINCKDRTEWVKLMSYIQYNHPGYYWNNNLKPLERTFINTPNALVIHSRYKDCRSLTFSNSMEVPPDDYLITCEEFLRDQELEDIRKIIYYDD